MEKIITKVAFYLKQASNSFILFVIKQVINMLYLEILENSDSKSENDSVGIVTKMMDHDFIDTTSKEVSEKIFKEENAINIAQNLLNEFSNRANIKPKDFSDLYKSLETKIIKNINRKKATKHMI